MITGTAEIRQVPAWQAAMARAVTDPAELLQLLGLGNEWLPAALAAARQFPLRVPRGFVARMMPGDPHDPLLRQVLPLGEELECVPGFHVDPVGDRAAHKAPGVLHKYAGRALLIATGACAVHCRYCFRRHFPYVEANAASEHWQQAVQYLADDPSVEEVILSGGDPLMVSDRRLQEFVSAIASLTSLKRLRLHTRLPVVLPERVTDELAILLGNTRLPATVVIHANHPRELSEAVGQACARLRDQGVVLLNQSVLLRGVNDDATVLAELSRALFAYGVLPYYLHLLDRVQGSAHFEVPEVQATAIHRQLHARLSGYLVPRLVRENAGAAGKTVIL